jgi:hypothetical protein
MSSSVGNIIPNTWNNKKDSKPPTRHIDMIYIYIANILISDMSKFFDNPSGTSSLPQVRTNSLRSSQAGRDVEVFDYR